MLYESEALARELFPEGYGYPLWIPEPCNSYPKAYRTKGVSIGDVGIITSDGSFEYLFNIVTPANHPCNFRGVPRGFESVTLSPGEVSTRTWDHLPGSYVASRSISLTPEELSAAKLAIREGISPHFELAHSTMRGAILILPEGASSMDLRDHRKFHHQAVSHATSWYHFATIACGHRVRNGSLHLVTGCDKASSWSVQSMQAPSDDTMVHGSLSASQSRCSKKCKRGQPQIRNQCVFIRGYTLSVPDAPEHHRKPVGGDAAVPFHPCAIINKHLLESTPSAQVALTYDDDWYSVLQEGEDLIDNESLLHRLSSTTRIIQEGDAVFLVPREK